MIIFLLTLAYIDINPVRYDIDEYIESMKLADEATQENTKKIQ